MAFHDQERPSRDSAISLRFEFMLSQAQSNEIFSYERRAIIRARTEMGGRPPYLSDADVAHGLDKLAQIELGWVFNPMIKRVNYRQVWEELLQKTVVEGRPLSSPPPFFVQLDEDPTMIKEIQIRASALE
jgi:hypothetical protein